MLPSYTGKDFTSNVFGGVSRGWLKLALERRSLRVGSLSCMGSTHLWVLSATKERNICVPRAHHSFLSGWRFLLTSTLYPYLDDTRVGFVR